MQNFSYGLTAAKFVEISSPIHRMNSRFSMICKVNIYFLFLYESYSKIFSDFIFNFLSFDIKFEIFVLYIYIRYCYIHLFYKIKVITLT